ncbi:hypothetical protein [Anaerocolumna jejuensis]|uniref:hypothetical protein n=1 Tax=Anaerocolumna jejuensis TaxID=259063 RepID=UPI003F7CC577
MPIKIYILKYMLSKSQPVGISDRFEKKEIVKWHEKFQMVQNKWIETNQNGRFEALQEQRFTKKDWTLFKNKIADWQEAYMNSLNKEYIELLSEDANPSEKFWRLDKKIKEDRKKTGVQLEMSRSNLIYNIISLINDGAISFEDLEEFSDELKKTVSAFVER